MQRTHFRPTIRRGMCGGRAGVRVRALDILDARGFEGVGGGCSCIATCQNNLEWDWGRPPGLVGARVAKNA